ncbi:MAG: 16S rRNA (adenine(1518)-N(6)/adenine(1519)-N(6))-dimethyltransferase RsmA [Peptococcaceae bacterium]|nr:16S rRNA (adenine(1518)-N(6)/adenine(1519)-N(6))-dimethyltransferase RsmA [Peptococcaceae bacterium]
MTGKSQGKPTGKTKQLLTANDFRAKKKWGQNFLLEPKFVGRIIDAADLNKEQVVLEIGPGLGALTKQLAERAKQVVAVEIDGELVALLKDILAPYDNVQVCHGDAMKVDLEQLVQEAAGDEGASPVPFSVVANLPYYITTPIVMRLLEQNWHWQKMVLMVQKEVAERMVASPGGKDYGALSLGVQYRAEASIVTIVPPTVFYPRPQVDSAVVLLENRLEPPVDVLSEKVLFSVIKGAFAQRRKTLLNALSNSGVAKNKEQVLQVLAACGIAPERRGETLSLAEFAAIANGFAACK